ncbi:MAG: DUF4330 domain-containing protein [Oscillospiraceae bacterium]|nr:DUF4330 domain-containing protein [Oscillospiraceae bacterium]
MNKDGKIKGKFNIIDLLVIILIIAVIAGIVVRYGSSITRAVKSDEEFEYTVKVESVRQFTIDALQETMDTGSHLTDKKSNLDLGTIIDIKSEDTMIPSQKADGTIVPAPQEGRKTAYVTIRTRGKEADNSYITADSNELSVGGHTEIFSKYVHTSGLITSVKKINE